MNYSIQLLSSSHNREDFDCGNQPLNTFLQKTANQHAKRGISRTFVLVEKQNEAKVLGFMTLNACEVQSENVEANWTKKFPRTIPAVRLSRLAIEKSYKKLGFGSLLLVESMKRTVDVSNSLGVAGLFVDAKDRNAKNYYEKFGFIGLPDQLSNLFLPLDSIKNALKIYH